MTIAVKIVVEPLAEATAVLYETNGNNKKRTELHRFTADQKEFSTHIWKGRDLVIEEVEIT